MEYVAIVLALVVVACAAAFYWQGRVVVPAEHVGIVERTRLGVRPPKNGFRKVTPYPGARGIQAGVLVPGSPSWLLPGVHRVRLVRAVRVPDEMIGVVTAVDGAKRPHGQRVSRAVECDDFQDARAFLLGGGEQGTQIRTLASQTVYYLNPELFSVRFVPQTYVQPGTVGLVVADVGAIRPPDRPLGRYVPCNHFQDAYAFLVNGGEQGRQLAILAGGSRYDINPEIFQTITVDTVAGSTDGLTADHLREVVIDVGHTGVVVTLDGREPPSDKAIGPPVPGHGNYRLPWVFLHHGGQRGVQQETLGEGAVYSLNPWFVRVLLIPTKLINLTWSTKTPSEENNYDAELEPIVVDVQGYQVQVNMAQSIQIPPDAAPRLVSQFGGASTSGLGGLVKDPKPVQGFVDKVLGAIIETYFTEIAAASTAEEFREKYASTRADLATQVKQVFEEWGVRAVRTTLGQYHSSDPGFAQQRQKVSDEQARGRQLEVTRDIVEVEEEIDAIRFRAEARRMAAEARAEAAVLGPEEYARLRQIEAIAKWKGPEYIGGGSEYLDSMPMMIRSEILDRIRSTPAAPEIAPERRPPLEAAPEEDGD